MDTEVKGGGKKTVTVTFDGEREFHYVPGEKVSDLLDQAVKAFGVTTNPHTMALYAEDGSELLNLEQSLKDAGVKAGDTLVMRPSAVRGG